jgi:site-specific DNA recombinase
LTRAAIYARISETDRNVLAIADQVSNLRALAEREGCEVVAIFSDDGISAWSGKLRPAFLELLQGIDSGDFDVVLAVAEDRLSRNEEESYLIRSKSAKAGVKWHTLASGVTDPSTAQGGLMAKLNAALAEYESAIKSERVQRSIRRRLANGDDIGGPRPFGWEVDRKRHRPEEADLIRLGVRMILDGATVYKVARTWTESGVTPPRSTHPVWRSQTVRHIILNPRNAGRLVVNGVEHGALPAIIDPAEAQTVAAILNDPSRRPKRGPVPTRWTATGLAKCGACGEHLTVSSSNGAPAVKCSALGIVRHLKHPVMRAAALENQIADAALMGVLWRVAAGPAIEAGVSADISAAQMRIDNARTQLERITLLAVQGIGDAATLAREDARLKAELAEGQAARDALLARSDTAGAVELAKRFVTEHDGAIGVDGTAAQEPWRQYWHTLEVDARRRLMRGLFRRIELLPHDRAERGRLLIDGERMPLYGPQKKEQP